MEEKIFSKKRVGVVSGMELDSVVRERGRGMRRVFDILMIAQQYWCSMDQYRRDRDRNKKYCYGDQWSDRIVVDGKSMSEEQYIKGQGSVPLKSNLIRRLVKNVLGVYRSQSKEPICKSRDRDEQQFGETMSTILQCNMQLNRRKTIDARSMEEFLIGGFVVHRKSYGWRNGKLDCWTDYVNPNNFFIDNNMRDMRGWDVSMLGEVHDISFDELCQTFASDGSDVLRLKSIYESASDMRNVSVFCERFG